MAPTTISDELLSWEQIKLQFKDRRHLGLLLGNGASRALWDKFSYDSLYTIACDPQQKHSLTPTDQAFFREMETTNFEAVLSALATTRMVCGHLKKEFGDVEERYQSIRTSLIEAVRTVHVPVELVPVETKQYLGDVLSKYRYVYTINYDLLLYWAMMETKRSVGDLPDDRHKHTWKDFLWGRDQSFDSSDAHEFEDEGSRVLYLHGALHLEHDLLGNTKKKVFQEGGADLLSQFDTAGDWIPLFVSEGESKEKLRSIRRNDYLSFAYWKFSFHRGPLVVFGSTLSNEFDQHILDAMKQWQRYDKSRLGDEATPRQIAISVYPETDSSQIIAEKSRLQKELRGYHVYFFDSTTHPLGNNRRLNLVS
jgi:hypothetical protein